MHLLQIGFLVLLLGGVGSEEKMTCTWMNHRVRYVCNAWRVGRFVAYLEWEVLGDLAVEDIAWQPSVQFCQSMILRR